MKNDRQKKRKIIKIASLLSSKYFYFIFSFFLVSIFVDIFLFHILSKKKVQSSSARKYPANSTKKKSKKFEHLKLKKKRVIVHTKK